MTDVLCTVYGAQVYFTSSTYKQNRESTEGYSKSIVRKSNDKFAKKIGLNK